MRYGMGSDAPAALAGKAVVITGGTTGIGRATAIRLAAAGAKVLVYGRNESELRDALRDIEAAARDGGGEAHGMTADQAMPGDVERVFAAADEKLGGVDVLVNNAALAAKGVLDMDCGEIEYVVRTNLLGYLLCCKQAVRRMEKQGGGHIVNVGSMSATVREKGSDVYVATKSGIEGFSEALRKQINEKGVKVTLIEPGLVGTDMTVDQVPADQQSEKIREGEMLKAEDIAECVVYALTQPKRCDVVEVRIRPHGQAI